MVQALKAAGSARVKFTLYQDGTPDAWTKTYKDPQVWEWLLRQKRAGGREE
jgi:predicted peptidase